MRAQKYHFQSSEQTLLLFFSVSRHIASAFGRCMPSLFDKTTGKSLPTTGCIQKKRICKQRFAPMKKRMICCTSILRVRLCRKSGGLSLESRRKTPFTRLLSLHSSPRRLKISACRPKARKKIVFLQDSMVSRRRILPAARRLHLITPLCPTTTPLPFPPNRRSSVSPSTNSPP